MDLNEGICPREVQVTCLRFFVCLFCFLVLHGSCFFGQMQEYIVCFEVALTFSPCLFSERSQLLLLLLLVVVQEVQNHAESPEFYRHSHLCLPPHVPALRIQFFPDQKWLTSLKTFV